MCIRDRTLALIGDVSALTLTLISVSDRSDAIAKLALTALHENSPALAKATEGFRKTGEGDNADHQTKLFI